MERAEAHTQYRMRVTGTVGAHLASALGADVEAGRNGSVLVGDYVDQAHLTGLILRLHDLCIQIQSVHIIREAS